MNAREVAEKILELLNENECNTSIDDEGEYYVLVVSKNYGSDSAELSTM